MIRAAFITTSYPRTATDPHGHFIAKAAEGLAARGVSMSVYVPHFAAAEEREMRNGVDVHRFRYAPEAWERVAYGPGIVSNMTRDARAALAFPAFVRALRGAVRDAAREHDIVHVHWSTNAALALPAHLERPVVLTIHGSDYRLATRPGLRWTLDRPLARASRVVAVSEHLAGLVRPHLPGGAAPLEVVPCGIDAALLDLPVAGRPAREDARIMCVSRLVADKGVLDLIDALVEIGEGFVLEVVGVGPEREEMARRAQAGGIGARVEFSGAVEHEQVLDRMRDADLVVMASHSEGCGIVPIEAAGVGTAAVVTRTGAMPEVAGSDAAIVEPGDVAGLAAAIKTFLADPGLRASCAETARAKVRREFTWDHVAARLEGIYEDVLAEHGVPRESGTSAR